MVDSVMSFLEKKQNTTLDMVLQDIVEPGGRDINWAELKIAMYAYILHQIPYTDLRKAALNSGLSVTESKNLRQKMVAVYESNLELKQNALFAHYRDYSKKQISRLIRQSSVNDAFLIENLYRFPFFSPHRINTQIKERPIKKPETVRIDCSNQIITMKPYIERFVNRKLRFICKANNHPIDDLVADLMQKGAETYYRVTPFYEGLHRENFVKRAIHNEGMRLIESNSTLKRRRLVQTEEGGFSNVISGMPDMVADYFAEMSDPDWFADFQEVEIRVAFENYLKRCKPLKQKVALRLLRKTVNDDFLEYVKRNSKSSRREKEASDNAEEYLRLVAEFYELPEISVRYTAWELMQILSESTH